MKDPVDKALQELADFAAKSWSNNAIVERIEAIRKMRTAELAHNIAMRKEVCAALNITPGALVALSADTFVQTGAQP